MCGAGPPYLLYSDIYMCYKSGSAWWCVSVPTLTVHTFQLRQRLLTVRLGQNRSKGHVGGGSGAGVVHGGRPALAATAAGRSGHGAPVQHLGGARQRCARPARAARRAARRRLGGPAAAPARLCSQCGMTRISLDCLCTCACCPALCLVFTGRACSSAGVVSLPAQHDQGVLKCYGSLVAPLRPLPRSCRRRLGGPAAALARLCSQCRTTQNSCGCLCRLRLLPVASFGGCWGRAGPRQRWRGSHPARHDQGHQASVVLWRPSMRPLARSAVGGAWASLQQRWHRFAARAA